MRGSFVCIHPVIWGEEQLQVRGSKDRAAAGLPQTQKTNSSSPPHHNKVFFYPQLTLVRWSMLLSFCLDCCISTRRLSQLENSPTARLNLTQIYRSHNHIAKGFVSMHCFIDDLYFTIDYWNNNFQVMCWPNCCQQTPSSMIYLNREKKFSLWDFMNHFWWHEALFCIQFGPVFCGCFYCFISLLDHYCISKCVQYIKFMIIPNLLKNITTSFLPICDFEFSYSYSLMTEWFQCTQNDTLLSLDVCRPSSSIGN